ncbi:hypothetical protein [Candidatus Borrarchaeum sp.]|uniref:hypothetical protein n=1 Tax=Candidatus Borrarchaeum sp. TaxID=2846742 RepID=UPI002579AC25|nr:hypothetical protein [Candidatus Borrarchaeum sp.]
MIKVKKIFAIKRKQYHIQLIDDVEDWEIFNSLKNREDPPIRYRIIVRREKNILAEYVRNFNVKPSSVHLTNFFKKILRNEDYRGQYLDKGNWEDIIEWDDPVNPKTKADINRLNSKPMKKLRFKDFANLKVGGRDGFSTMKEEELDATISDSDKEFIEGRLHRANLIIVAKRWAARGLQARKAVRKIKTDEEIRINFEKSRSR